MNTVLPCSAATIRTGVTRSVSLETTAAASKSPFHASFKRWEARLTSEPFSSTVWNPAITAFGNRAEAFERLP